MYPEKGNHLYSSNDTGSNVTYRQRSMRFADLYGAHQKDHYDEKKNQSANPPLHVDIAVLERGLANAIASR